MDAEHTEAIAVDEYKPDERLASKPKRRKAEGVKRKDLPLKPRAFVPRACTSCATYRPANTSYSEVYATRGRVRYCKCKFCQATWTQTISADQS